MRYNINGSCERPQKNAGRTRHTDKERSLPAEGTVIIMKQTNLIAGLLTCVLVCLSLFACSPSVTEAGIAIPSGMQAIAGEAGDYDLIVPDEWLVGTTVGMTSAYVEDAARSSVSVTANELAADITSIEAYWEMYEKEFRATFADFAMVDEKPSDVTVGTAYQDTSRHTSGLKYRYTATVGGVKYQWMQVLCVRGATMYIITYTSTAEAYESNVEDVTAVLANLYFR